MKIKEMNYEYGSHLEKISKGLSSNEYDPVLHKLLVKEEDIASLYSSADYKKICLMLEEDYHDICTLDQLEYERILKRSDNTN